MVAKTKKKISGKKSAVKPSVKVPVKALKKADSSKQDDLKTLQLFWQAEIKELQGKKFSSYKTAVGSLLASVCERLKVPDAKRPQTIERLSVIFETSALLKQSLLKHLQIKK